MIATATEAPQALNLAIASRDCVIVGDIYDDAARIFGQVGQTRLFDLITTAIETLALKSHWDPLLGLVSIDTVDDYYFTLPRYVETVLRVNVCRRSGLFQSRWMQFHLQGPPADEGPTLHGWIADGETPVNKPLKAPSKLVAIPLDATDDNALVKVYGYDINEQPVCENGKWGITVPCISHNEIPNEAVADIARIERVTKARTQSFIELWTSDGTNKVEQISLYWPTDLEPIYQRIRLARRCARVSVWFRKRWPKVTSLDEPIFIRPRMAIISMFKSMAAAADPGTGDPALAAAYRAEALEFLADQWLCDNPDPALSIQADMDTFGAGHLYVH
jgi:hypothetical protein